MDRFDELKLKYQGPLNLIKQNGTRLANLHVQDNKLYMKGACPSEDALNDVWNQIKLIDPSYGDLTCDLSIDDSLAPPPPEVRTYVVQPGDSLWKIAAEQMGNGARYPEIISANSDYLKNEKSVIHPGDVLVIPD
jgi:nucleoid-associated protein YgaU